MVTCCAPKYTARQLRESVTIQGLTLASDGMGGFTEIWASISNNPNWVQLTTADLSPLDAITFQNTGENDWFLLAGGASAPTSSLGSLLYPPVAKEATKFSDLFPGLPSATRIWIYGNKIGQAVFSGGLTLPRSVNVPASQIAPTRAMIDAAPGSERFGYMRQVPGNTYRMVTRYFATATAAQRVIWRGKEYGVLGVVDPDGRQDWLEWRIGDGVAS